MIHNYKSLRIQLLFLFVCIFYSGCKKAEWYDIKPLKSLSVPVTLKDMQAIMDYGEMNYYSASLGEVGSDGHYISDANFTLLPAMDKSIYTWSHNSPYQNLYEWSQQNSFGAYVRVYYCNLVLEGLTKIIPANVNEQSQWNSVKGQALFQRSRTFFEMAQVFAPPFNLTTSTSDLSIPIRLESDINIPSQRSSIKETYDRIINDLSAAKDLLAVNVLPITDLNKNRPTYTAALAMLARVFLSIEDYANAAKYANECLNKYNTLLSYDSLLTATSPNRPFKIFNPEIIWQAGMSTSLRPLQSSRLLIDSNLYNLYIINDLRKTLYFTKSNTTGLITFKGQYTGASTPFTGLASDEIYLIRAETYARAGNVLAAMIDFNDLLRTRWKKDGNGISLYSDQIAIDAEDALRKILLERKKELLLRGLRWIDLRRLNKDERFKITLKRETPDGIFLLEPNSYKYTYPIPDDIIAITGMKQNPGW